MNKDHCDDEIDFLHHYLNEQITRICVLEEEERMKEEDKKDHSRSSFGSDN